MAQTQVSASAARASQDARGTGLPAELETALAAVETRIAALGHTLTQRDAEATERAAADLRIALSAALAGFAQVARLGKVPAPLRQRLLAANAQMAAQREALARASLAVDGALDILLPPRAPAAVYGASGTTSRNGRGGIIGVS